MGDVNQIDKLVYTYANNNNSNLLLKVDDNLSNSPQGFNDGNVSGNDYEYDDNGNMIIDNNKGITSITYNHLNLPTIIQFGNGNMITYLYNAIGQKVNKLVKTGQEYANTDYLTGFQYRSSYTQAQGDLGIAELQYFPMAEGYVQQKEGRYFYVYHYTDHLGNIRLSYSLDPETQMIKIMEENHYYPFGLKHEFYNTQVLRYVSEESTTDPIIALEIMANSVGDGSYNYRFNQKEWQDELSLNVYDYGARRYDPAVGRWSSMDPLAEKYETLSPYNYVSNNPVNAIDPDGRLIVYVNGLLTTQALFTYLNPFKSYKPERWGTQIETKGVMWNGREVPYWGNMRHEINSFYGDEKNVFVNGSHHFGSQASERFEMGKKAGNELISQLQNGTIALDDTIGETIKIVGHSQGAAHAAGMLTQLLDSEYANRLEVGIFISSHQPGGFGIPDGVPGLQFSTETDRVSSRAGVLGQLINLFNGSSELKRIEGSDYLLLRQEHKGGLGGHSVSTWTSMDDLLQQAYDFLNKE